MLNELNLNGIEEECFYSAISSWLTENRKAFRDNIWETYGLGQLSELNPTLFKVECLEGSVDEHIRRFNNLEPSSLDSIAMIIRDILWDMVAFKTQVQCPNCQEDDFRALLEPKSEEVILSCDLCCWSQSLNGNKWSGSSNLIPANKGQLSDLANQI